MSINHGSRFLLALTSVLAVSVALGAGSASSKLESYRRPLSFEPNRGQTDKRVDFLAHATDYSVLLSRGDAALILPERAPATRKSVMATVIRLKLIGGNSSSAPEPLEEQASKSNYFIGNKPEQWRTSIPNYAKVRYQDVYPGIDLIYYGNQRQLEYDFVVSPGSDPGDILMSFGGLTSADLDAQGDLVMHTPTGEVRWHRPIAYQEVRRKRMLIACAYTREAAGRLAFSVGAYDRSKPLVIDPVLEYSTFLGGSGSGTVPSVGTFGDVGNAIAVDAHGDAYIAGFTFSADFPTKNAFENLYPGYFFNTSTAFVSKFNTLGELVYSTYLGGSSNDQGTGIAVDAYGNAYVTGEANSVDFPIKDAFQSVNRSVAAANAFITKLDPEGNALVYSTYLGGSVNDYASAIAIDNKGNAYITGITTSTDFPFRNGFQRKLKSSCGNAFVAKLDAAGTGLWYSTYLGGSGCGVYKNGLTGLGDVGNGIAVDRYGQAYVTGTTVSSDFPTKNAFQAHLKGTCRQYCSNAFIAKLASAGCELVYSTYLGGSGQPAGFGHGDSGNDIAVDTHGNAYVTGYTNSTDFPIKSAYQGKLKNLSANGFLTKLDGAGTALAYSTYLGGTGGDGAFGIAVDAYGNAYITGSTGSSDFPIKNAFQGKLGCGPNQTCQNAFVTKFDAAGTALVYSSYLGGSNTQFGAMAANQANGIAVDSYGNAYVTGLTSSANFPMKNAFQTKLKSHSGNAFVTKISAK